MKDPSTFCYTVYDVTNNLWLAGSANWLITKPVKILMIIVIAFLVRLILRRLINRVTTLPKTGGKLPSMLRPLRERAPEVLGSAVIERRRQRAMTIGSVLKSMATFLVYGLAFILVLGELGIDLGPIIASAGIIGVAIGFGAQNLVKDFLSGIFMMVEDQYGVGDVVDVGEASGTVESVGLRITTLRDVKGTVWYVRNGEVLRVGNSSQGFAVALVDVPLGYTADVERAATVLAAAASTATESDALKDNILEPPEMLGVESVTPEGLQLRLTVKVRPGKQWAVQRALRAQLLAALEEAGFDPPLGRLFPPAAPTAGK
ncbi:small conductance mechanosensitive ion channel, MscS family [Amycolatopsis mediterranei S699]|uniref:Small conductance mechanosensitive ion channel, MscS family n=1 Tax=Amycolatopsis mediterranei (strain U-32) TaxID=749927 RepID=A0A0H3DC60_AMYMU|nr:mechanosensitive ion channel domain-containing protein [Amycolatopsis mediterranei]ADJ48545.1 small conductance mechanosensitive ion channel, MscS family [Amycolatopsis mediterranei U32]AFO80254.1 small conductance mechanosensitive ion channel, MscS family [Amycolatopsis mediterranei S699]AGT87382.1 small conductance mechanosensitive ion channel, MscS family [Amycolatopsis mediterranei RB]KDO11064.1 mechanosensitive ion channel protein MscS [Amycolatopsis mediterranei]KDU88988.1 mechanosens